MSNFGLPRFLEVAVSKRQQRSGGWSSSLLGRSAREACYSARHLPPAVQVSQLDAVQQEIPATFARENL